MAVTRLLLLSNSTTTGLGYLEWAGEAVRDFLDREIRKVTLVPYASVRTAFDLFTEKVSERFAQWGLELESVHASDDPAAAVRDAEAIAVAGGNTFRLLHRLYETGLVDAIRSRVHEGAPYIGWSAGSNVACPTIMTTNDMPIIEPPSLRALGLVPFQINPHFTEAASSDLNAETREDRLIEYVALNPGMTVVGLREGTALRVEGRSMRLVGDLPATLFALGRDPWKLGPDGDWGALLP